MKCILWHGDEVEWVEQRVCYSREMEGSETLDWSATRSQGAVHAASRHALDKNPASRAWQVGSGGYSSFART